MNWQEFARLFRRRTLCVLVTVGTAGAYADDRSADFWRHRERGLRHLERLQRGAAETSKKRQEAERQREQARQEQTRRRRSQGVQVDRRPGYEKHLAAIRAQERANEQARQAFVDLRRKAHRVSAAARIPEDIEVDLPPLE